MLLKNITYTVNYGLVKLKKSLSLMHVKSHCLLCRGHTSIDSPVCNYCQQHLPAPHATCPYCGIPKTDSLSGICGQCLQQRPPFDICLSPFIYLYPVNHMIQSIKYNQRLELIPPMVNHLMCTLKNHYSDKSWPEAIIPVPLHKKKIISRGYNQSLLLANDIQRKLPLNTQCQVIPNIISKQRNTLPQQKLPARDRRKNIKGAFTIKKNISYRHLAVVDDVVTTSETASEISRVLKNSGVKQVDIWCLARTDTQYK